MYDDNIVFRPLGHVRTPVADDDIARKRRELISDIEIHPEYADGLTGLDAYSHIIVLFWMDRANPPQSLLCHPRGDESLPRCGVFAARGRNHPNGIGLAVCELLKLRDSRLTVTRLDAFDGTPVLDLKPYDDYDRVDAPRVPDWFKLRARA